MLFQTDIYNNCYLYNDQQVNELYSYIFRFLNDEVKELTIFLL